MAEAWTDCLDLEFKKHNKDEERKFLKSIEKENVKDNGGLEDFIKNTTENNKKIYVKNTFDFNRSDYPNGRAFVKILRVQTPESARKKLKKPVYASIGTLQTEGDQVINYVLKYTTDENSKNPLVKNDEWFRIYDSEIKNIRAISFFGVYKTLISKIENKEYDQEEIKEDIRRNSNNEFYTAIYDDDHKYVLIKTTEEEILEKKRFNMVKSAFNTLKIQLESKIRVFNIIELSIAKNNIFKIQDEILSVNELSNRIYNTFKRLEKLGEVIEVDEGFKQSFHNYTFKNNIYEKIENLLNVEEIKAIKEEYLKTIYKIENIEVVEDNPPF